MLDTGVVRIFTDIPISVLLFRNRDDLPNWEAQIVFVGRTVVINREVFLRAFTMSTFDAWTKAAV